MHRRCLVYILHCIILQLSICVWQHLMCNCLIIKLSSHTKCHVAYKIKATTISKLVYKLHKKVIRLTTIIQVYFGSEIFMYFCKNAPKFLSRKNIFTNDPCGHVERRGMATLLQNEF